MRRSLSPVDSSFCAVANNPAVTSNQLGNHLLAALTAEEMRRLRSHLEPVALARRSTLHDAGGRLQHAYFPTSAVVSLIHVTAEGASAEVGVVANEGLVGVCALLSGGEPLRAVVRSAGYAHRIKLERLRAEFQRGARLQRVVQRYACALIAQLAQTAACYRRHSLDQQLCRWLLTGVDRMGSNEVATTQEGIASMLGVRREGVTEAASSLQKAGLIKYSRGRIAVLSRAKLEARACECYKMLRTENDRLVRDVYSARA
jgi:CRP-like cAMP-binding protein